MAFVLLKLNVVDDMLIKANKSKADFADDLQITATHLSGLLSRRHSPSAELRDKIMSQLDITDWGSIFEINRD